MSAPGPRPTSRTPTPWRHSKKLSRPRGRDPPEACARYTDRGVVAGRDAGWPEEQAHLSMGQDGLTPPRRSRSTHPVDLSVRGGLPRTRGWRRPGAAGMQQRGHATASRRDRHQSYPRRARDRPPRSSRVARRQGSQTPKQPLAHAAAAARTRTQRSGKHLEIHAAELALEPCFRIFRRHRRPLLLRLEHPSRSALEDHVHRTSRLGERGLLNVRIGMIRWHSLLEAPADTGWPACAGHDKGRVSIIPALRDGDQEVAEYVNARHRFELFRIDEIRLEGEAVDVAEQLHQSAVLLDQIVGKHRDAETALTRAAKAQHVVDHEPRLARLLAVAARLGEPMQSWR